MYALENIGRTVELFPHLSCMMKVSQEPRTFQVARAVGGGIQNFLFADPRTVQDVEECVAAMRAETPGQSRGKGIHGVGMQRDVGVVLEGGTPGWVSALNDGVCALMIEKKQAVDDLVSLLSVPGVDMVNFGATDYSVSVGVPGQDGRPGTKKHRLVEEAELKVITTALRMGIQPRVEGSVETMPKYQAMGVKHFCIGGDLVGMWDHFNTQGDAANERLGRPPPSTLPFGQHRGGALPGAEAMGYTAGSGTTTKSKM